MVSYKFLFFFLALVLAFTGFAYVSSAQTTVPPSAGVAEFSISDIGVSFPNPTSAIIRWTTDAPANSEVEYGLSDLYGSNSGIDLTQVFSHAAVLANLKPGLVYFYRVISADNEGNRIASQRFVFSVPQNSAGVSATAPTLTFTAPRQHDTLKDAAVFFTYQINGTWPAADKIPHAYIWADVLRNGTWIERAHAFDIGSRTEAGLRSGSFTQKFAPGTYRISGLLAASKPRHEMLRNSSVSPLIFTVQDASSTEVVAAASSSLLALPSGPKIKSGDRIRNWRAADVRQVPSRSNSLIGVQTPDTKGTIIGGPELTAGSRWWNINYDVGYDGWTSEDFLLPINAPVFDFELASLEDGASTVQGSSADFSFGGRLTSGTGQLVAFSLPVPQAGAQGIPSDAYAAFSPASCTLPCLTTLHISTLRTTPVGVYPITITAISSKKEKKTSFKLQISRFSPVPSVSLTAPFIDGTVPGSNLALTSTVTGSADLSGSRSIRFQLDGNKEKSDALLNGSRTFGDIPSGPHILTGYLTGNKDIKIPGTDFLLEFLSDASLPVISNLLSQQTGDTSSIITWGTDKNSTGRVAYDSVDNLRFSTKENAGIFQKVHSSVLQDLVPCVQYVYRAYAKNTTGAESMSMLNRFATTGCLAPMLPEIHAEGIVSALSQRTLTLTRDDDRSIRVALPPSFSDNAAIQINALNPVGISNAAPVPTSQSRLIAGHAYRVIALKDPVTSIFTSEKPVTITMRYLPEDVADIAAETLKIWRWTGVDWTETKQCRTDNDLHEITCMTNEISTFALFGISSKLSLAPPSGALTVVAPQKDLFFSSRSNDNDRIITSTPPAFTGTVPAQLRKTPVLRKATTAPKTSATGSREPIPQTQTSARSLTRDLYRGMKHPEVGLLQKFLISRNYLGAGSNTGLFDGATETGVKKFQCDHEITCTGTQSTTGFGSVDTRTRARINESLK